MFQRLLFGSALSLTLASGALLAPSNAVAAEKNAPHTRDGKHIEKFIAKLEKELSLTGTQTAQVREILKPDSLVPPPEQLAQEGKGPRGGHGRGGMGMFSEEYLVQLRANEVDTQMLNKDFAERQAQMKLHHDRMVTKFVQLHGVLTPTQRLKLADILEKRRTK